MDDWLISWQLGPPNIAQGDRLSTLPPETFDRVASNVSHAQGTTLVTDKHRLADVSLSFSCCHWI